MLSSEDLLLKLVSTARSHGIGVDFAQGVVLDLLEPCSVELEACLALEDHRTEVSRQYDAGLFKGLAALRICSRLSVLAAATYRETPFAGLGRVPCSARRSACGLRNCCGGPTAAQRTSPRPRTSSPLVLPGRYRPKI